MAATINGITSISVSGKDKLERLKPFRQIGALKDHKLDRVIFENQEETQKLMLRCSEYLHATDESFIVSPSISRFSVDNHGHYIFDYHPLEYLEKAIGEESGYDAGFMFQAFDSRYGDCCAVAGLAGHKFENGRWEITTSIIYVDSFYATILEEKDLDAFVTDACALFFATQYIMRTRPTELKEKMVRDQYRIHAPGTKDHRRRVVQLVRTVYIDGAVIGSLVEKSSADRKIDCPCWGVMGHWRCYKSGKRVWIKPYRKGKERNNPNSYCSKDYKTKEVSL